MQPLLHAHQSQTAGLHRRVHIEAHTGVFHHQLNFTRETSDRYVEVACSAVVDRIIQSLMRHSEEAYRHVTGQLPGNVLILEHNVYIMLFSELNAETSDGSPYAQVFEFRGMQFVRESNLRTVFANFLQILTGGHA